MPRMKGRRVLQVAQRLDKALVVQAKAGELLDLLAAAHLLDELVVAAAQPVHDRVFLALGLAANDDFVALFPLGHKPGDHLHRVLEVGAHRDRAIAGGVDHAVVRAVELAEVLDVEDGLDVLVLGADLPDDGTGAVLALIVDEQNLIVVVRAALDQLIAHSLIDGAGILLLVVAGIITEIVFFSLILSLSLPTQWFRGFLLQTGSRAASQCPPVRPTCPPAGA